VSQLRAEASAPLVERLARLTPAERRSLERLLAKLATWGTGAENSTTSAEEGAP
jgi:hypothetical protein